MQSFDRKLTHLKNLVIANLTELLIQQQPQSLYEPIKYTLDAGGKRLRPVLLMLSAQTLGGDIKLAVPAATAIELLHNFTLVHDDIMDNDDTRRGRATVHQRWDVSVALLAGDGLVALAYRSLLLTPSKHLVDIARLFTDGILELCEGQALDREFETKDNVSMVEYLEMISKKTARLLSMCTQIGGMIADGAVSEIEALRNFGESLGIAFQIQDDLLDITTEQAVLGKDFGSDIKKHKKTFLLVHALMHASSAQKSFIQKNLLMSDIDLEEIYRMRQLFEEIGTIEAARRTVQEYISKADESLRAIGRAADVGDLKNLLEIILNRKA